MQFKCAPIVLPQFVGSGQLHKSYAVLPDYANISSLSELRSDHLNAYLEKVYGWKVEDPELWLSGPGKLLIDSFILSDRAKKFMIAKTAYLADNKSCYLLAPVVAILTFMFYTMTDLSAVRNRGGHQGPVAQAFSFIAMCALIGGNFYLFRFFFMQKLHGDADVKAITRGLMDEQQIRDAQQQGKILPIDKEYCEGAIEYYNKEIQRNLSLRQLMKKTTPWYKGMFGAFNEDGDYQKSALSYDPRASRCIRKIIAWKMGHKAPDS